MANHDAHHPAQHNANLEADRLTQIEDKRIAKEMSPFLIYAAIPVLLIIFIALAYGPSY